MITGPSGVGKGTLIAALRERIPELELSVSATTRRAAAGRAGRRRLPLPDRDQLRAAPVEAGTSSSTRRTRATATERCDPSSTAARGAARRSCSRSSFRARGRSARRCRRPSLVFIAPPSSEALRERLPGTRARRRPSRSRGGWRSPRRELDGPRRVPDRGRQRRARPGHRRAGANRRLGRRRSLTCDLR